MRIVLLLVVLLSSPAFSTCRVSEIIQQIRPGAEWTLVGDDPSQIVWLSTQTIPTKAEVQAAIQSCQSDLAARQLLKQQARLDVKNTLLTPLQRLQALLLLLDYDR